MSGSTPPPDPVSGDQVGILGVSGGGKTAVTVARVAALLAGLGSDHV